MNADYLKISDYSLIGDLLTCALVGKNGSIDWYCLPHINSPSVFAAILDINRGGSFSIQPAQKYESHQKYLQHTNILKTKFHTKSGKLTVTDFMPVKHTSRPYENTFPTLIRKVTCTKGSLEIKVNFHPRFNYARGKTKLIQDSHGIKAENDNEYLLLKSPVQLVINSNNAAGTYKLKQKETLWFALQYNDDRILSDIHCKNSLKTTTAFWHSWVNDSDVYQIKTGLFKKPWRDIIIRSGLTLKLLIQDMTGAICAAPTTSLPETIGGDRNWDYRFNWIRDAAFTVRALYKLGYVNEARKNLEWFIRVVAKFQDPSKIQVMYGLNGETDLQESTLDHLSGYKNSKPVRIGNGAAKQLQLDIYGELVNVFYETSRFGLDITDQEWKLLKQIVNHVCEVWNRPDAGIWEVRGGYQHFVHSKLMCWVAVDRGLKIANQQYKNCPRNKWEDARDNIKASILSKGFNSKLNSFVQAYDSDVLDSSSLLIPIMKLLPYNDIRVQGTVNAVIKDLTTRDGLVYRYKAQETADGFNTDEGAFLLCSFWLIDVLAYSGRIDEARALLLKMLDYASPTGLLPEEIDPITGDALGNYPQAYSHIGLINSALFLEKAKRKGLKALSGLELKDLSAKLKNIIKERKAIRKTRYY